MIWGRLMWRSVLLGSALAAAVAGGGCQSTTSVGAKCTVGSTEPCDCPSGKRSIRTCGSDREFGECACGEGEGGAGTGGRGAGGARSGGSDAGGAQTGGAETEATGGAPRGGTAGSETGRGGSMSGGTEVGGAESGGAIAGGSAGEPPTTGGASATGGVGTGGKGTGGSVPGDPCCAPLAPLGWTGPVPVHAVPTLPSQLCPDGNRPVLLAGSDVGIEAGSCGCDCVGSVECPEPAIVTWASGCGQAELVTLSPIPDCATGTSDQSVVQGRHVAGTERCDSSARGTPGQASFSVNFFACEAPPPQVDCGSTAVCVPAPPPPAQDTAVCVFRTGDVPCPTTGYTQRQLVFEDIVDDRACECDACQVDSAECRASVAEVSGGDCAAEPNREYEVTSTSTPRCFQSQHISVLSPPPTVTCTPGASRESGEATPDGPNTVCCLP